MSNRYSPEELHSAHERGRVAFEAGLSLDDNVFDKDLEGELHNKWEEGFLEAEEDDNVDIVEAQKEFGET